MGQRDDARIFAADWNGRGDEKSEAQKFWIEFFYYIFEVEEPTKFADFEKKSF